MHQNLEDDQRNRLWEHGLHEDTIFYSMLNFFLVFESVLLGVVGLLYSKTISPEPVLKIISVLGLSVTLIWGYAQIRQRRYIKIISAQAQKVDSNYEALVQIRGKGIWSLSVMGLLAYAIPTLIFLVWIALLFVV
jgi:amino acid permease